MKASESLQNDQSSATENEFRRVWFSLERRSLKRTWIAPEIAHLEPFVDVSRNGRLRVGSKIAWASTMAQV